MNENGAIRLIGVLGVAVISYFAGRSHELYLNIKKRADNLSYANGIKKEGRE